MGPWVREADDEEEDSGEGGRLRRVAGKRGVLVRQQRSLESTLVGELARGAIVELATDAVEAAARCAKPAVLPLYGGASPRHGRWRRCCAYHSTSDERISSTGRSVRW